MMDGLTKTNRPRATGWMYYKIKYKPKTKEPVIHNKSDYLNPPSNKSFINP